MKQLIFLLSLVSVLAACQKQEIKDDELIATYISEHSLNATKTDEGLYYVITTEGTGVQPTTANTINMDYEGFLLDGTSFDAGTDVEFPLSQLIEGFKLGLPYFKEGGSGILLIPSHLGYGKAGVPGAIPKNAVLRFNVTLNDVL